MNTKQMIAAAAMFAATGAVFAQQTEYVDPAANFVSTKSRADVLAELKQAQQDGTYVAGGAEYPAQPTLFAKTNRTRGEAVESASNAKVKSGVAGS